MDYYCFVPNQSFFQTIDLERVIEKAENIFNFYLDFNWEFQFSIEQAPTVLVDYRGLLCLM